MFARKRRHHFLLLRHCVRSTTSTLDLNLEKEGNVDGDFPQDAQAYVNASLPKWGVPENWCTEKGLEMVKTTGQWLLGKGGLLEEGTNFDFEIIADGDSQRDIDTAWALSQGMDLAFTKMTRTTRTRKVRGLHDIRYEAFLFDPMKETAGNIGKTCQVQYTEQELLEQVSQRLATLLPRPELNITQALDMLQEIAGVGQVGILKNFLSMTKDPPPIVLVNKDHDEGLVEPKFAGATVLIKLFAEMLFYSRAAAIDPPFAGTSRNSTAVVVTPDQIYQLLQYNYWSRSILCVDNAQAATKGAVLAQALLRVLARGYYLESPLAGDDIDYDTKVTILVGHDGNLDDMATALGVRWEIGAPYKCDFMPTPPMSGIHVTRNLENDAVAFSFVYPVYSQVKNDDDHDDHDSSSSSSSSSPKDQWISNTLGILEQVPLIFGNPSLEGVHLGSHESVINADTVVANSSSSRSSVMEILERRIRERLATFKGASECFETHFVTAVLGSKPSSSKSSSSAASTESPMSRTITASFFMFLVGTLLASLYCKIRLARQPIKHGESYRQVELTATTTDIQEPSEEEAQGEGIFTTGTMKPSNQEGVV